MPVAAIDGTLVKAALVSGPWAVDRIKMPVFKLDWRMKPNRVIKAGSGHTPLEPSQPVRT